MKRWIDSLEEWCTRPSQRAGSKPLPKWLLPLLPAWNLRPAEKYSVRLYLQNALMPVVLLTAFCSLVIVGGACLVAVYHDPHILSRVLSVVIHDRRAQAYLARFFLSYLIAPVIWAIFSLLIYLPRFYFWNRRAERLQQQDTTQEMTAEVLTPGVWPPPPNIKPRNKI